MAPSPMIPRDSGRTAVTLPGPLGEAPLARAGLFWCDAGAYLAVRGHLAKPIPTSVTSKAPSAKRPRRG